MIELLAVMITAVTAVVAATISAYRKPPEVKILDLQRVINEAAQSKEDADRVRKEIRKQFQKIGNVDYSWILLLWAVLGAIVMTLTGAVYREAPSIEFAGVVAVVVVIYLLGFVTLVVAATWPVFVSSYHGLKFLWLKFLALFSESAEVEPPQPSQAKQLATTSDSEAETA